MFELKVEITKWQVCGKCGGGSCETCGGKGEICIGEGTPAELVKSWATLPPETLERLKELVELAKNEFKES